jgi:hypothetical protein
MIRVARGRTRKPGHDPLSVRTAGVRLKIAHTTSTKVGYSGCAPQLQPWCACAQRYAHYSQCGSHLPHTNMFDDAESGALSNTRIIRIVWRYTRSPWSHGGMRYRPVVLERPWLSLEIFAVHVLRNLENKAENEHDHHCHCLRSCCTRDQYQRCKGPVLSMQIEPMPCREIQIMEINVRHAAAAANDTPRANLPASGSRAKKPGLKVCPKTPADQWERHVFEA